MGFYEQQVVPRAVDVLLGNRALGELRTRALAGVSGEVLEIGFGSGPNLEYYPAEVTNRASSIEASEASFRAAAMAAGEKSRPVTWAPRLAQHNVS